MKEVAEKLGVSYRTVQRWQDERLIAFTKIGKVVRISEDSLQGWLEKRTIKPVKKIA